MRRGEYGGYIEIERHYGEELYPNAIALNCGRNCLAYLIEQKKISRIFLPYFLCSSVLNVCKKYGVDVVFYNINMDFRPSFSIEPSTDDWLYLVNYYGQISNDEISDWRSRFPNLIVDNAQAIFQPAVDCIDTIYTCRKYFGVADGAYLVSDAGEIKLEQDYSYDHVRFLLGRYEKNANEFYSEYVANNRRFREEPIKSMSKLTHNMLRGIDYEKVTMVRRANFAALHERLGTINGLALIIPDGAFMYPFYVRGGAAIRNKLQKEKIYIPTLWPDVFELCGEDTPEYDMANNILPLPVDQRYTVDDMEFIAGEVLKCIN